MEQGKDSTKGSAVPGGGSRPAAPSLELPDLGQISGIPPRASRTLAALVRLHRVTGPRQVRVVLDPETVCDLEPYCTVSASGRPTLGGWELIATPDAGADQVTLYDANGGWVIGAFTPHREVGEPGSRVYEGLRRAGYAIPDALDLSGELGPPMDPGTDPHGGTPRPNPSTPTPGGTGTAAAIEDEDWDQDPALTETPETADDRDGEDGEEPSGTRGFLRR